MDHRIEQIITSRLEKELAGGMENSQARIFREILDWWTCGSEVLPRPLGMALEPLPCPLVLDTTGSSIRALFILNGLAA